MAEEYRMSERYLEKKYNRLDMDIIKEALEKITGFAEVILRIAE